MSRPKISVLSSDCTIHTLARTRILTQLLMPNFDVEVISPKFPGDRDGYAGFAWPCRYTPVPVRRLPGFARSTGDLIDTLTGDVVYASKPRMTSFGVALLARLRRKLRVVVDVDDWEIYHCYPYSYHVSKNMALSFPTWSHPNAYPLTFTMDKLVSRADHVTSVSSFFQRLFGGTVVPQAVDTELFDPARFDRERLRQEWNLDHCRVVLFLGRPLPHKGLEEISTAVEMSRHQDVRLVIVGGHTPYIESFERGERVIFLGPQPFATSPAFLAMADVVMVPQRVSPISLGQMPVKVPEAMAMGVPVIASAVSDLPEQIGDAGLVVPTGDIGALARALDYVLDDEARARAMGQVGRRRAVERYSIASVSPMLERVFAPLCPRPYLQEDRCSA